MMTAYTPAMAERRVSHGLLKKLAAFFKALFETNKQNPHNLDNATSARLYL